MDKVGFFQSGVGRYSSTRLMSFLAFIVACALAFLTFFVSGITFGDSFPMIITFLAYSVGAKSFDKVAVMFGKNEDKG